MRVIHLKLENVRTIETVELHFQPGFNLIIGINGVGKTTIIDALSVCLSAVIRRANALQGRFIDFDVENIRRGEKFLNVVCDIEHNKEYGRGHYKVATFLSTAAHQVENKDTPHEESHLVFDMKGCIGKTPSTVGKPFSVLFSTRRAVPLRHKPTARAAAGGVNAAFSSALSHRELRLGEFEAWMRAQEALKTEWPAAERVLRALERRLRASFLTTETCA